MPHAALVAVGKASTHTHKGQGKGGNKQWGDVLKHHEMDTATNDTDTNDTQTATVACFPPQTSINISTLQTGNAGLWDGRGTCALGDTTGANAGQLGWRGCVTKNTTPTHAIHAHGDACLNSPLTLTSMVLKPH